MTMLSPVAMLGWIGAVLLFLLALRTWPEGRTARRCARMGLAGMMLAMGAALYTHDVVSLPEMLSMAALGSGIGYLIARRAPMRSAWAILALLQGMIGAALLLLIGQLAVWSPARRASSVAPAVATGGF